MNTLDLLQHRRNVYSHNGEDGVLEFLSARLPSPNKWAIEFGAWDGKWASNTCHLLERADWNVVYIECDAEKFKDLQKHHSKNPKAHLVQKFIAFDGPDRLDGILKAIPGCPLDPDFISMDIDGCEYHLWESLIDYRPKMVLTEFNPSMPLDFNYVQPRDFSVNHSSSLKAFVELAHKKGYRLISILDYNALFLREDLVLPMGLEPAKMETLFEPFKTRYQTQMWQSMDGRIHLIGCDRLLWHNVNINPEKIQVLPRLLRINPAGTGVTRKILRTIYHNVPFVRDLFNFVISGRFKAPEGTESRQT